MARVTRLEFAGDNFNAVWEKLYHLIRKDVFDPNEVMENLDEVEDVLKSHQNKKLLTNILNLSRGEHQETLLMWAIWNLKAKVCELLLVYGANPHYINDYGEGMSTYWGLGLTDERCTEEIQKRAIPLMRLLNSHNVDLSRNSSMSYGLVKRAKEYDLKLIQDELVKLGYDLTTKDDFSDNEF